VANLSDPPVRGSQLDQFIRFVEGCGERFLDKHVDAGLHERAGNRQVMHSGRGNGSGANFAVRSEHLIDGAEGAAIELAGNSICASEVRIDNTCKSNRLALFFKLTVDASVITSEDAHTDDSDGDRIVSLQERNSRMAGCQKGINRL
jgi:hypothetical protein